MNSKNQIITLKGNRSWKQFYFELVYWSELLKEKYNYHGTDFTDHPRNYYNLIQKSFNLLDEKNIVDVAQFEFIVGEKFGTDLYNTQLMNQLLYDASENGYIDLIKYAIDNGADNYQGGMDQAAYGGQIEAFEYFRQNYPHNLDEALDWAYDKPMVIEEDKKIINHIENLINSLRI